MTMDPSGATSNLRAAILGRLIKPEDPISSAEAARYLLKLTFPDGDKERVDFLLAKNQDGQLTPDERAELYEYLRVDTLLSVLKSKARQSLVRAGVTSHDAP